MDLQRSVVWKTFRKGRKKQGEIKKKRTYQKTNSGGTIKKFSLPQGKREQENITKR